MGMGKHNLGTKRVWEREGRANRKANGKLTFEYIKGNAESIQSPK